MANEIYTTNSKSMPNASNSSPKLIPNPERNKEVAHVVVFDNGSVGGVFATVRHSTISYQGQRYIQYRLYFLPNEAYRNSIITFSIGSSIKIDLEPLNSIIASDRRWFLAKKISESDTGTITKSDFLVNDITKMQSVQNNVNTETTDIPQDILAILYNQNTDLVLINDIQMLEKSFLINDVYNIKNQEISETSGNLIIIAADYDKGRNRVRNISGSDTKVRIHFSPKVNFNYTMDQANAEFNRGNKYANFSQVLKHQIGATILNVSDRFSYEQNYYTYSMPYTNISDLGYPESQNQSYYRYGSARNKLFFKDEFMRSVAYDKAVSIVSNNINTIDTPKLIKTLNEIKTNATIRDATNEDLLGNNGEAAQILDRYVKTYIASQLNVGDDRIKRSGITSEVKLLSEKRKKVEVTIAGVDGITFEVGDGNIPQILRTKSSASVNKNQSFKTVGLEDTSYIAPRVLTQYTAYTTDTIRSLTIQNLTYFRKVRYPVNVKKFAMSFDYDNFQLNQDIRGNSFKNLTTKEKVIKEKYKNTSSRGLAILIRQGIVPYDILETTIPGPDRLLPAAQNYVKQIFNTLGPTIMIRKYSVSLKWNMASVSASYHKVSDKASSKTKFKNKNNSTTINISGEEIDVVSLFTT